MLHICFNKMLSGCVVCLLKYLGTKCPRLGTKCPSTKCTGTKCPGTKCPGTKCPYPTFVTSEALAWLLKLLLCLDYDITIQNQQDLFLKTEKFDSQYTAVKKGSLFLE